MTDRDTQGFGASPRRRDGPAKVTGAATFVGDLAAEAHAVAVRAEVPRGRIASIDASAALAVPGVLDVLTHENAPRLSPVTVLLGEVREHSAGESRLPLQDAEIRYAGQIVALVVARDPLAAAAGAAAVRVEVEAAPFAATMADPRAAWSTPVNGWPEEAEKSRGDAATAYAASRVTVDATYRTSLMHHVAMEPHATVAAWDGERLTVDEPTTWVGGAAKTLAAAFGLEPERVRVRAPFVGGSFGSKGPIWPHVFAVAMAAMRLRTTVKLVLSRHETFVSNGHRPAIEQRVRLGALSDGTILALRHDARSHSSSFDLRVVAPVTKTPRKLYGIANADSTYAMAALDFPGPFTMRAPGEAPGMFALECAIDELATALDLDPFELRRRNPSRIDADANEPWSTIALERTMTETARVFGWPERLPAPGSMRDGRVATGYGTAIAAYDSSASKASASASIDRDGRVVVRTATCDQGTGSYTIFAQIAAGELGIALERVRVELGDTALPAAPLSAGSQTAASVAPAVEDACRGLIDALASAAAVDRSGPLGGLARIEIAVDAGELHAWSDESRRVAFGDVVRRSGRETIAATATHEPQRAGGCSFYAFGTHCCEVRVDLDTGETRVARWVARFGAGRIVNPTLARSQLEGAIVWGISMALHERTDVDARLGRILTRDLAAYHVATNADVPPIDAGFIHELDPFVGALGIKGVGELGIVGAAAAVANAVHHATGVRVRELPIRPDAVLAGLERLAAT